MDLAGQVVVVTGAAQGIGKALAGRFHAAGARVAVSDRDGAGAQAVAQGLNALALPCDVADAAAIAAMVERVEAELGPIAVYASNAGILELDPDPLDAASASDASWARSFSVNVLGHVHAARALLPRWRARRGGVFLATVSAAGLLTQVGSATYSVTKHAALAFCEHLAITHKDDGVRVVAICPQGVDTAMVKGAMASTPAVLDGLVTPEAVAEAALEGLAAGRFLVLPHPQVAGYFRNKAENYDRWLAGMAKLRRASLALTAETS